MAKTLLRGLGSQIRPLFHIFWSTDIYFSLNLWIWTLQSQNWPILAKIGPNLVQNDQYPFKWPREPNKTTFPHIFKHWEWIFHQNLKFGSDMVKMGQFWPKTGPNLGQIGQNLIKRPREPNKTTFPHVFEPWLLIFDKLLEFGFYRVKIGENLGKNAQYPTKLPTKPKEVSFHIFSSTKYKIFKKLCNLDLKVQNCLICTNNREKQN